MKILHITLVDDQNGAGIAAVRLHKALINKGVDSEMLVKKKLTDNNTIFEVNKNFYFIDKIINKFFTYVSFPFWIGIGAFFLKNSKKVRNADIIHIHNIHYSNFFSPLFFPKDKPIVWTLHDMWALTGNCNYTYNLCEKFYTECNRCVLNKDSKAIFPKLLIDTTEFQYKLKKRIYEKLNLTIISPSTWLLQESKKANILKKKNIYLIKNLVSDNYKFEKKNTCKKYFKILFVGQAENKNYRKGFDYLVQVLHLLNNENIELVIAGKVDKKIKNIFYQLKIKIVELGVVPNESMVNLYTTCDVMVLPSIQDNLPNTVYESVMCGTPVVAFDTGGVSDLIINKKTGYLAKPFDIQGFANGIKYVVDNLQTLNKNCFKFQKEQLNQDEIISKYINLYTMLIKKEIK